MFVTMAYIIFVNPAILARTGMPIAAVTAATCLCAALGSVLMGVLARYPLALAPGMGLNAYFTYTVCLKMHVPRQTALGAVFLSGAIFLALTLEVCDSSSLVPSQGSYMRRLQAALAYSSHSSA